MKLYANARIVASGKKEFNDKEGNPVVYYENIIKDKEGFMATVNSQADYSEHEGKNGIVELQLKDNGKVTLKRFIQDESFEAPEKEIY